MPVFGVMAAFGYSFESVSTLQSKSALRIVLLLEIVCKKDET